MGTHSQVLRKLPGSVVMCPPHLQLLFKTGAGRPVQLAAPLAAEERDLGLLRLERRESCSVGREEWSEVVMLQKAVLDRNYLGRQSWALEGASIHGATVQETDTCCGPNPNPKDKQMHLCTSSGKDTPTRFLVP